MREDALKRELHYYEVVSELGDTPVGEQLMRHIDVINLKAAAVLTHLSIMVAVSVGIFAFWFEKGAKDLISFFMLCEILGYIGLTLFALIGAMITNPESFMRHGKDSPLKHLIAIVRFRRISLLVSIYGTFFMTIVLIFTLSAKVFFDRILYT